MYLLYLDETENSDGHGEAAPVFALGGLMATARYIPAFEAEITRIRTAYSIPEDWEIRGFDIFSARKWRVLLSEDQRRAFCEAIADAVSSTYIKAGFFACRASTASQQDDYLACLDLVVEKAADKVAREGSGNSKQLMVIFDEKDEYEVAINRQIRDGRAGILKRLKRTRGRTCHVIDGGFGGRSDMSTLLQIADFVAYVLRYRMTIPQTADPRLIAWLDQLIARFGSKVKQLEAAPAAAVRT